jgi:hypothetical protein
MGFFTSLTKLIPQMVQDPSFGQPIGWGKNIIPIATLVRDSALQALPAGNAGVPQGSNAPAASGKGPTDIIGGLALRRASCRRAEQGEVFVQTDEIRYIVRRRATDPNARSATVLRVTPLNSSPRTRGPPRAAAGSPSLSQPDSSAHRCSPSAKDRTVDPA